MRRNLPKLCETAKMIQPYVIAGLRSPAQASNPPLISPRPNGIPVIKRVSPPLTGGAECVWWDAGDDFRIKILIQTIQFRMRPHIGAVVIHKNGNITYHAD